MNQNVISLEGIENVEDLELQRLFICSCLFSIPLTH